MYNEISNIEIAAQIALSFEIVHNEMLIMINVLISYVQLLLLIYISTRIFFYKWQMHITMFETWSLWRFLLGKKAKKFFYRNNFDFYAYLSQTSLDYFLTLFIEQHLTDSNCKTF